MGYGSSSIVWDAAQYAREKHAGQVRKSTGKPFYTHLDRAADTLMALGAPEQVVAATYLHDVVEDTGASMQDPVTFDDVEAAFDRDIRTLVQGASEHTKDASWADRKRHTVTYLRGDLPDDRVADPLPAEPTDGMLLVVGADKLDNLRSFRRDLQQADDPDSVWDNFNETDPRRHAWYYGAIGDVVAGRLADGPCASLAAAYEDVYQDVLGGYDRVAPRGER